MFGDKALELIRELKRSMEGAVPPYSVSFNVLSANRNGGKLIGDTKACWRL